MVGRRRPKWRYPSGMQRVLAVGILAGLVSWAPGCQEAGGSTADVGPAPMESSTGDAVEPWFEVGYGEDRFTPLAQGGVLPIVWGAQGAAMFPMALIGGGFTLPDDPQNFADERAPIVDVVVDIDGYNVSTTGHFKEVRNVSLGFHVLEDGSYRYLGVRVIVPPEVPDPAVLQGRPAYLWVQLRPYAHEPLLATYELTVDVAAPSM